MPAASRPSRSVQPAALARISAGPPQTALPWAERRRNVRGAFAVRGPVRGARIALVDDVMTTGATLAEACADEACADEASPIPLDVAAPALLSWIDEGWVARLVADADPGRPDALASADQAVLGEIACRVVRC